MGLFDKLKSLFGDANETEPKIDEAAIDWDELLWNPVKDEILKQLNVKIKRGGNYAWFDGNACRYVMCYLPGRRRAKVYLETVDGEAAKNIIDAKVASAPAGHILKQTVLTQNSRNKDKYNWVIENTEDKSEDVLIKWYSESLVAFYEFMESAVVEEKAAIEVQKQAEKAIADSKTAAAKVDEKPAAKKAGKTDGELPGVFTLEDGRKICFSKGNLQFHCKNYEFKFAEEQYETLGKEANEKCAPNYDGWIDIFGWGTSGYMGCQPTERSFNENDYGPATGDLIGENANYDWGVYNPISNGGNKEGLWRTPTRGEMDYLLRDRPNAAKLKLLCTVCGKSGMILMPDDFWSNRLRFPIDITSDNSSDNKFDAEQWGQLESLGVVFFPRNTYKEYSKNQWIDYTSLNCWTSVRRVIYSIYTYEIDYPCIRSVRLVKDVK